METARFSAQKLQRAEPSKNHKARKMKKMAGDFSRSYSTFAPESERCPKIRQIKTGKISRPGTTAITLRPELTAWKETKRDRRTQRGGGCKEEQSTPRGKQRSGEILRQQRNGRAPRKMEAKARYLIRAREPPSTWRAPKEKQKGASTYPQQTGSWEGRRRQRFRKYPQYLIYL